MIHTCVMRHVVVVIVHPQECRCRVIMRHVTPSTSSTGVHRVFEIPVDLLGLLCDEVASLGDNFNSLLLVPPNRYLEPLFVLSDFIVLLFQVYNQPLHDLHQLILTLYLCY